MSAQIDVILAQAANDPDVMETQEWLDALEAVLDNEGPERAHYLRERMVDLARRREARLCSGTRARPGVSVGFPAAAEAGL